MNKKRVVITGMGVMAPNGTGVDEFYQSLLEGKSGISFQEDSAELGYRCQIGGVPKYNEEYLRKYFPKIYVEVLKNQGIIYGCLAGLEAWEMAGLPKNETREPRMGLVFGSGATGMDILSKDTFHAINNKRHRVLGTTTIPQSMNSGAAAYLNQILGLGGPNISNSSACTTGSESILIGYEQIQMGKAEVMICGSSEGIGRYIWGAFDAMRILCPNANETPETGSRPMSNRSSGFVPSGGSGSVVLETLESAQNRGATIYAELIGAYQNCGGMRDGGSMTAPNPSAAAECIRGAIDHAGIAAEEIDLISGHLTSTMADPLEIKVWKDALDLPEEKFPLINTPKSMIGHCIAGAGSVESVASILQIHRSFVHKNLNLTEDTIHPEIAKAIPADKIVLDTKKQEINTVIKSNFGFGDVNCCLIFRHFDK
ncbi:MAG: beta-ketoacyl-[acyl-carrier-protein] synthase family protein [Cyclobacteriaceae bacterium]